MVIAQGFRFRVEAADVFPEGCVMGADPVVAVTDIRGRDAEKIRGCENRNSDFSVWAVRVHDLDKSLIGQSREVIVEICSRHKPVPPAEAFQPVEFEGLTIQPWVDHAPVRGDGSRGVMRFSIHATGFKVPE